MKKDATYSVKGFTLIELLVVLIVVGILAAFALPRFADFQDDAYISMNEGTGAAFKSAVALAHIRWASLGFSGPADNVDLYGSGQNLMDMNANGWPAQSYPPFEANPTLNNTNDCISVWRAILSDNAPTVATDTSGDYQVSYSSNTCTFTMVKESGLTIFYDSNTGSVVVDSVL